MKLRTLALSTLTLFSLSAYYCLGAINIAGTRFVNVSPASTTGLSTVIVAEDATDAFLSYTASSDVGARNVKWYKFSAMGGAYAEPLTNITVNGNTSSVKTEPTDMGYLVQDGVNQTAIWVVNYATHYPTLTSFHINLDNDCDRVMFTPDGGFDRIVYYSINGAPTVLDREIELIYDDLQFISENEEDKGSWQTYSHIVKFNDISGIFSTVSPLCNTNFTLSGDRFLKTWSNEIEVTSEMFTTRNVDAKTWATQEARENDNEQNSSDGNLGGSAPCIITFTAIPTEAVTFREWQFSYTETFDDVLYRFNEDEFTYTFNDEGTLYARYVCGDASGECMYEGDVYTITIGQSKLLCPNAFSPHNQDGVNDEWKVSYSSIVSFQCNIFNRWGQQLYSSNNPAQGWDGKVGGKFVPSGVYFYVITAEGADGVKYKLSGDINVVASKLRGSSSSEDVE